MALYLTNSQTALLTRRVLTYATCWSVLRRDGVTFRFTDHDQALTVEEITYYPAGGFNASARQKQLQLRTRNVECVGMVTADFITAEDLRAGRYREAQIVERLVDWRYPWEGVYQLNRYWISEVKFNGQNWEAQVDGLTRWLRANVGDVYSRHCRHVLGDEKCRVDVDAITVSGTVSTVMDNGRHRFIASDLSGEADRFFANGLLTWTSGDNVDLAFEVADYQPDGTFRVPLATPYDMQVGDTFDVYPGCDHRIVSCVEFEDPDDPGNPDGNIKNFGGFPDIPGTDRANRTPLARPAV